MNRKGLGKGLDALIPDFSIDESEESGLTEIEIAKIMPNPYQPRTVFQQEKLEELAQSIKEHGVVQPIIVAVSEAKAGFYQLVAGERRLRAAKMAGLAKVPALVREYSKNAMVEIALIENLQREDLNPIEEAEAYNCLIKEFGFTQEQLARRLGRSRSTIANTIRLLSLSTKAKEALAANKITPGQARPLLSITDHQHQWELAEKIIANNLSAREVEQLIYERKRKLPQKRAPKKEADLRDPHLLELEEKLEYAYGTKVRIKNKKGKGMVVFDFYDHDDLQRILELLLR
ncbi:MAG: ParB/RepB/Spo0J family partition protein [Dethiobacteria bacterium]|jgi:ParB family chromosome partitioning protein|nr:ParB/RepB/Spo0J family partition protein [Bacillota bacterium]